MQVCKEAHAPVAYSVSMCPVCMAIDHYQERLKTLEERIEVLESELSEGVTA